MSQKKGDNQIVNESYISATGCLGLEFDNIEPLKNLIDQVTGEYHNKMLGYLEAIESLQGKLRFSSLSLTDELNQCYESINRQNRSLNNFKEQLDHYVRKVNDTEDRIIEQLGKIKLDTEPELPDSISVTKPEAIIVVSKEAVDVQEKEEEESTFEWLNNLINDTCNQLLDTFSKSADWMTSGIKKMKEKV